MPHPMVTQLHFARSEFCRCLAGVSPKDAVRRINPMNCLSWTVGHLANQEQFYWVQLAQDKIVVPGLHEIAGTGSPAGTPDWEEMWTHWHTITQAADTFLNSLTPDLLDVHPTWQGRTMPESYGTLLLRNIYHYWFHTGEAHATRQMLGHANLPEFVGKMDRVHY